MKQIPSVVAGTSKKYTLNLLHRNHLQSIRSFSAEKQKAVAKSLKNMLMGIGENDDSDEK